MKFILFVFFCALLAVSFARPQQTLQKNGPAKWYRADGDGDDGDNGYGTGDGGLKLDGEDGPYDLGEPVAITGAPRKLYRSAGDDKKSDNGEPVAATGEPDRYKVADDGEDQCDNGKPLAVTGGPRRHYKSDGGDQSDNGEPVAVTGGPKSVYLRTHHVAGNAYNVSSAVAQKYRHGQSVAHVSHNGPHKLVARK